MIEIHKSKTADTRSCDFSQVTKEQLLASSIQHIGDVEKGIGYLIGKLYQSAALHDHDKVSNIVGFHADFITGFAQTGWWDEHRKINRHHLLQEDGIPADINLIDVLEMIVDCVMAGMGRTGSVYPLEISPDLLKRAFNNTVELLKAEIIVLDACESANTERCLRCADGCENEPPAASTGSPLKGCAAEEDICSGCNACQRNEVGALEQQGHTYHCAARMIWGDGICECKPCAACGLLAPCNCSAIESI